MLLLLPLSLSSHVSSYWDPCRKTDSTHCFSSTFSSTLPTWDTWDEAGADRDDPSAWAIRPNDPGYPGGHESFVTGSLEETSGIRSRSGDPCDDGRTGSIAIAPAPVLAEAAREVAVKARFNLQDDSTPGTIGVIFRAKDANNYFRWDFTLYDFSGSYRKCEAIRYKLDGVLYTISSWCGSTSCSQDKMLPADTWHDILISLDPTSSDKVWVAIATPEEGDLARSSQPHLKLRSSSSDYAEWSTYFNDPTWNKQGVFCSGASCLFDNFGVWTRSARYVQQTIDFPRCSQCSNFLPIQSTGASDAWCRCCFYDCEGKDKEGYCNQNPLNTNPARPFCLNTAYDLCDGTTDPTTGADYTDAWCPNCYDGILNQDEVDYPDCGGTCNPCTCSDGVRNGGEIVDTAGGVDCGGECGSCSARCSNGRKDGDETGIDCGGANCGPCPTCYDGVVNQDEGCGKGLADQGGVCSNKALNSCGVSNNHLCTCPTPSPTPFPTPGPTTPFPTVQPTLWPTLQPTQQPTRVPTRNPTPQPTLNPTEFPTAWPTRYPTPFPTTPYPTAIPTRIPTPQPTGLPTPLPPGGTHMPTAQPTTHAPTVQPTVQPTVEPTVQPTLQPTVQPTVFPTAQPTEQPTSVPTPLPLGATLVPTLSPTPAPPTPQPTPSPPAGYVVELRLARVSAVNTELAAVCSAIGIGIDATCDDVLPHCRAEFTAWVQDRIDQVDAGALVTAASCGSYLAYVVPSNADSLLLVEACNRFGDFECTATPRAEAPAPPTPAPEPTASTAPTMATMVVSSSEASQGTDDVSSTQGQDGTSQTLGATEGAVGGNASPDDDDDSSGGGTAAAVVIILLLLACGGAYYWFYVKQERPSPWQEYQQRRRGPNYASAEVQMQPMEGAEAGATTRGGSHAIPKGSGGRTQAPQRPPPTPSVPSPSALAATPAAMPIAQTMREDSDSDDEVIVTPIKKDVRGSRVGKGAPGSRARRAAKPGTGSGGTPLLVDGVDAPATPDTPAGTPFAGRTPGSAIAPNSPDSPHTPVQPRRGKGGKGTRGSRTPKAPGSTTGSKTSKRTGASPKKPRGSAKGGKAGSRRERAETAEDDAPTRFSNLLDFVDDDEEGTQ